MSKILIDRSTVEQVLEAWDGGEIEWFKRAYTVMENLRAALAEPVQDGKCKHCVDGCPACDARKLPVQEPVATMTVREDIIRMAREADDFADSYTPQYVTLPNEWSVIRDERFFHAAYAAGAAAERNAILQMSREQWFKTQADFDEAIRAREST